MIQDDLEFACDFGNYIFQDYSNAVGEDIYAFYMEHVISSAQNALAQQLWVRSKSCFVKAV
ncbi:hypothetical protein [Desulfobacula sp.]|uniref:hypothetical protein n=1 Tax=Desulfobacula sp. TaxID=2593537 RepID=UPI001ECB6458|nr:hypothetical protein [Desulfobacula sp.]